MAKDEKSVSARAEAARMRAPEPIRLSLSDWQELPRIELYMDQLISIIQSELEGLWPLLDERRITTSMINNYVKVKLAPAPQNKRYERSHIAALLMIFILKTVLSMQDLSALLGGLLAENGADWSELHAAFRARLTRALLRVGALASPGRAAPSAAEPPRAGDAAREAEGPYTAALTHALRAFAERFQAKRYLALCQGVAPGEKAAPAGGAREGGAAKP